MAKTKAELLLYRSSDGSVQLDVQLEQETIWLSQAQIAELFSADRSVITKHLRNIFSSGELDKESVCAKFAHTAEDGKTYSVQFYNLDAIISVGYRVNSKRGTEFRIWATHVLKQHIVQGYTANEKRLKQLKQTLKLASDISKRKTLSGDEASILLQTISDYARALDLLDDYDHQRVSIGKTSKRKTNPVTYEEAMRLVEVMRKQFSDSAVFGIEKDESLHSSLNAIMQSFDGKDLYPSVEEKAAHLLYFMVKNYSFVDGNKRIAAAVFLRFLDKNRLLYDKEGSKRIADNALVAMTLMITESHPREKEIMTAVVANLIGDERKKD
ncbi:virulence RhuM family protein [Desulfosarcina sp. OttesenSCG-928-A07]|nr:virulence RhuM family protein [Desulfosarcina sp. OttesenSCG-928-G17]MDL2328856.1 virulence RhuM family protein [Desulfosarcina sp. OttesenSCG-928-A07]